MGVPQLHSRHGTRERQVVLRHLVEVLGVRLDELLAAFGRHGAVPRCIRGRIIADAGVALADQKRMATQMAVLTQLHVARLQYANAARQFERADMIADVDGRIARHVGNQERAERQTRLERVSQQTTTILSVLRRYQAQSNMQAASSRLQATLGMEPVIEGSDSMPLPELTQAVGKSLQSWDAGQFQ